MFIDFASSVYHQITNIAKTSFLAPGYNFFQPISFNRTEEEEKNISWISTLTRCNRSLLFVDWMQVCHQFTISYTRSHSQTYSHAIEMPPMAMVRGRRLYSFHFAVLFVDCWWQKTILDIRIATFLYTTMISSAAHTPFNVLHSSNENCLSVMFGWKKCNAKSVTTQYSQRWCTRYVLEVA